MHGRDRLELEKFIALLWWNRWVCPKLNLWSEVYLLLLDSYQRLKDTPDAVPEPAPPLILAAWPESSAAGKWFRFTGQLRWAHKYGDWEAVAKRLPQPSRPSRQSGYLVVEGFLEGYKDYQHHLFGECEYVSGSGVQREREPL